jgi:hypothetical protein
MVLVDTAHNVLRGMETLFGSDNAVGRRFVAQQPFLKKVLNHLENFDGYLRDAGTSQLEG